MNNENAIEWYTNSDRITVSLTHKRFVNKVLKLAEQYPDEVDVVQNPDGSICAHLPLSYLKISHPKVMSDEQREAAAERMRALREG